MLSALLLGWSLVVTGAEAEAAKPAAGGPVVARYAGRAGDGFICT